MSLNFFSSLINCSVTIDLNEAVIFTCCTFSVVPKLILVNCSSLIIMDRLWLNLEIAFKWVFHDDHFYNF